MLLPGLTTWLVSKGIGPVGRKLLGAGLVAAALLLVGWRIYRAGGESRERKVKADLTEQFEKERQVERKVLQGQLEQAQRAIDAALERETQARERFDQAMALVDKATERLAALQEQRQEIRHEVARVPDSQLAPRIKSALGLRAPADQGIPGFTTLEERELLRCVLDYPLCEQQNREAESKIGGLTQQIAALEDQVGAVEVRARSIQDKVEAVTAYTLRLEGFYAHAFNAIPRSRGFKGHLCGIFTFYRACKPAKVKLPGLDEIKKLRPELN